MLKKGVNLRKRLRKKLYLNEYTQYCIDGKFKLEEDVESNFEELDKFFTDLLGAIESFKLYIAGGDTFSIFKYKGSVSAEEVERIDKWLKNDSRIKKYELRWPININYPQFGSRPAKPNNRKYMQSKWWK